MTTPSRKLRRLNTRFSLRILSIAGCISFLTSIVLLLAIPAENSQNPILGLSLNRFFILLIPSFLFIASATLFFASFKISSAIIQRIEHVLYASSRYSRWLILLATIILLYCTQFILQGKEITEPFTQSYYERLTPLALAFSIVSFTFLLLWVLSHPQQQKLFRTIQNAGFGSFLITFGSILCLWGFIAWSRIGLIATDIGAGWNSLGTPLLGWQAILSWGATGIITGLLFKYHQSIGSYLTRHLDLTLCIIFYVLAFILWMSAPLAPSWFAAPPRPPNFEYYPNSDASVYDTTAQSALAGSGFSSWGAEFAIRPFYAFILALFHLIEGPGYEDIIWLQVLLLAFIPVLFYALTKRLHNRFTATIAALFIIFREYNAIWLGDEITNAHAKLLMSDLPTTLTALLAVYLGIQWLQQPKKHWRAPLWLGTTFGVGILIRPEFAILLASILIIAYISYRPNRLAWFRSSLLIILATFTFISPWIGRNYLKTGKIFLDYPHFRADLFAKRYRDYQIPDTQEKDNKTPAPIPQHTPSIAPTPATGGPIQDSTPPTGQIEPKSLFEQALQYVAQKPQAVIKFIANHFTNSAIQSVLYLPSTYRFTDSMITFLGHRDVNLLTQQCCQAESYIRRLPFWHKWDGALPKQSFIPVLLNLSFISLGIVTIARQHKWLTALPLLSAAAYYGINALVRNSGGRYILPMDWIGMLYFAAGIGNLTREIWVNIKPAFALSPMFSFTNLSSDDRKHTAKPVHYYILLLLFIFSLGMTIPLFESLFPETFDVTYTNNILQKALTNTHSSNNEEILQFIQGDGIALSGIALYPRFHPVGVGEMGSTWPAFYPRQYPRITFYMVGERNIGVILPHLTKPDAFPNGAEVLIIGCARKAYIDALAVIVHPASTDPIILYREGEGAIPVCNQD